MNRPIGVFDSGLGGLSVVEKLFERFPSAKIIYLGDTARVPYGGKNAETLIRYADEITDFLVNQGCGIIIDACNSTSAVALPFLKGKYSNPIIGVIEPGIKAACATTKNGHIGVIATMATVESQAHRHTAETLCGKASIFPLACPEFVPLVERGEVDGVKASSIVAKTLKPLLDKNIDTLILGCTHYPYLAKPIQKVMGSSVTLVDPADETVNAIQSYLTAEDQSAQTTQINQATHEFYVTGDPEHFQRVALKLLGKELPRVRNVVV